MLSNQDLFFFHHTTRENTTFLCDCSNIYAKILALVAGRSKNWNKYLQEVTVKIFILIKVADLKL